MHVELPVELWITIFRLAADDEILYANANPTTAWHTSNWFKLTVSGVTKWTLRSPQDEIALLQHRRTRQMKVRNSLAHFYSVVTSLVGNRLYLQILETHRNRVPIQLSLL